VPPAEETVNGARLEMILQQIDALPTLSPIAVRVLELSGAEDADLRQIARVIESDPALTARLLALCRRADRAVSTRITTVDRAAVMLGLEAVRAAMLSVEVFEVLGGPSESGPIVPDAPGPARLDRRELWRHCLACACAAELLAETHPERMGGFRPQEAFLAGILHDIGKLALDRVLPRAYAKVVGLCDARPVLAADIERTVLGLDHHVAGKRLAEHWGLPHALQDVVWLHGHRASTLPDLPHLPLVAVVTVADQVVRRLHLGWSGSDALLADVEEVCLEHGFDARRVKNVHEDLRSRLAQRARDLGLDAQSDADLLIQCVTNANRRMGRLVESMTRRAERVSRQAKALAEIASFHETREDRRSMTDALGAIVRSAASAFGDGFFGVLVRPRPDSPWAFFRLSGAGDPSNTWLAPEPDGVDLASLADTPGLGIRESRALGWLGEQLGPEAPVELRVRALASGAGLCAVLVHDRDELDAEVGADCVAALTSTWGAALAGAGQHDGARRLSERLADANRELVALQTRLVETESMARLGELAAGAAHEMNNPLTVISGNLQLLEAGVEDDRHKRSIRAAVEAADRLTDLISALHLYAESPVLTRTGSDIRRVLDDAAEEALRRTVGTHGSPRTGVEVVVDPEVAGRVWVDPRLIGGALSELIANALLSGTRGEVEVRAHLDPFDDRLFISVSDEGRGLSERAQKHAFDPFFSEHPAGRRSGLGLTRARRLVELHGGTIVLESGPNAGTCARIVLPDWRAGAETPEQSEAA